MPELPEVNTTVVGLQQTVIGYTITDIWTDLAVKNPIAQFKDTLKSSAFFEYMKKHVLGQKITGAERRAKNILIHLENNQTILVHMKMTGHMMIGQYTYNKQKNNWIVSPLERNDALLDPYNRFIHVVFSLSKGKTARQLVLCDSRKFAKVTLLDTASLHNTHFKNFGPEPLDPDFTAKDFRDRLLKKPRGKIKTVLMDQTVISGIGNIYSDEMLWLSGVHPERIVTSLTQKECTLMYTAMRDILQKGIEFGGDSTSDYRNIHGQKGAFHAQHSVYRETNKPCKKRGCPGIIQRKVIGARSAHFCPVHQK